jgi:hypothetical protein
MELFDNSFYTNTGLSLREAPRASWQSFCHSGLFAGRMSGDPASSFIF